MFTNNLTNYNNNNIVDNFFDDLNSIFTSSNLPVYDRRVNKQKTFKTSEDESGVTLTMEVPGYSKSLIEVTIESDTLIITGKSNSGDTDGFVEKFDMVDTLDSENVEATVVDGLLTIMVPFKETVLPKQIKVKVR